MSRRVYISREPVSEALAADPEQLDIAMWAAWDAHAANGGEERVVSAVLIGVLRQAPATLASGRWPADLCWAKYRLVIES